MKKFQLFKDDIANRPCEVIESWMLIEVSSSSNEKIMPLKPYLTFYS